MNTPTPRTDTEITFTGAYTCAELSCNECNVRTAALTTERDQLRAELANQRVQNNHNWQFQGISEEALKRAERAEAAETIALAHWNKELGRAMKAEAELAAERARLNDLVADLNDACITIASVKDDCDDYAMQNTAFKLTAVRDVLLQYIPNAAMKGGAK